jgi:hypothetical protein
MAPIYRLMPADLADLPYLYEHYATLFGSNLIPIETMRKWVRRNPHIVWRVVRQIPGGSEQMIGFFDIEPLTESGQDKLHSVNATASSLLPDDISPDHSTKGPSAYYIGSIGCPLGSAARHRGETVVCLIQTLMQLSSGSPVELLAHPASKAGLRLMKDVFAMVPLHEASDKEGIWRVLFNSDAFSLPKSYSRISNRLGIGTIRH